MIRMIVYLGVILTFFSCDSAPEDSGLDGEALAQIHCKSCHQLPNPKELDKSTWTKYVLPRMGFFLGFRENLGENAAIFDDIDAGKAKANESLYFRNTKPIISEGDWEKIQAFYSSNAPEFLKRNKQDSLKNLDNWFRTKLPTMGFSPPGTSLIHFSESGNILMADIHKEVLLQFDLNLDLIKQDKIGVGGVKFVETKTDYWLAVMGAFEATDAPMGSIIQYPKTGSAKKIAIKELQRPVDFAVADFDQDGAEEMVICEFGKYSGSLSLFKMDGDSYKKRLLAERPGAQKVKIVDWDKDGDEDLVVLYGQAEEGIYYYKNDGKGNFEEQKLAAFPASYGSTHIDIADIDKDGDDDILYSCGDNADYPALLKPYHGIRILEQTANMNFREKTFLPLNGAYKSISGDFDNDGILDIAAISFFPDYENGGSEYFTLFKGQRSGAYIRYELSKSNLGRFCTMDVKDVDNDGDLDIVIGSLSFEIMPRSKKALVDEWASDAIPFVFLENITVK